MAMARKGNVYSCLIFFICAVFNCALGIGKYSIYYAPSYMHYLPAEDSIDLSEIPLVIKNSFGFSTANDLKWTGLSQSNPFKRPKAQVLFSVEGLSQLLPSKYTYPVRNDVGDVSTELVSEHIKDAMSERSLVFDFSQQNPVSEMQSLHPAAFGHIPVSTSKVQAAFTATSTLPFATESLNVTVTQDLKFLSQVYLINAIVEAVKANPELSRDAYPDFYHFRVDGFEAVVEKHGAASPQKKDAENILKSVIQMVIDTMQKTYQGSVVIQVVSYDVSEEELIKLRSVRSLQESKSTKTFEEELNVSKGYDDSYPVTFNIILWTMVILAITVFAVSYGIWNMDPGHDSIIYRMTSQRLKRD